MITDDDRIKAIDEAPETGEWKSIVYRSDNKPKAVKRIPLKYLLYNRHNGRIRSHTKSYESQYNDLDPKNPGDVIIIEQFLFDSAAGRNAKTLESLAQNGQQEVGIVTKDGIIIDGNRRAMLLNRLSRDRKEEGFFNAIVLPDRLIENEKEIVKLETSYQMGVDSKVDYNPIEKYIRCSELNTRHELEIEDIAHIMAEDKQRIEEWLNILKIMDSYLEYLQSPGVYTRLEKREGHFVDLYGYLKSYKKRSTTVSWNYTDADLEELQKAYFDYIRLGIPVLRARVIAKPSDSFFRYEDIWNDFLTEKSYVLNNYKEPDLKELEKDNPNKSKEDIIRYVDTSWKNDVGIQLMNDLSYAESLLKDKVEQQGPVKILKRVINSLGQIDYENLLKSDKNEIFKLLKLIEVKIEDFRNFIIDNENSN